MANADRARCLSQETLAAFLEERLTHEDAARCHQHIDDCSQCREEAHFGASHLPPAPHLEGSASLLLVAEHAGDCGASRAPRVTNLGPPAQLDEYLLKERLGQGAMGEIYLYEDTRLERPVAVKFIGAQAQGEAYRERFLCEARAIAKLSHPNVLAIHRVGENAGRPFLVCEYIRGQSLAEVAKPLRGTELLRIAVQLSRGLAAAHRRGVLHRDIKPSNVMLTENGEVKLLDFGLAKLTGETAAGADSLIGTSAEALVTAPGSAQLTDAQSFLGTPLYAAPEIWRGEVATPRSDVYSLGALLFELAVGQAPHQGKNRQELARAVLNQVPPALQTLVPTLDERLAGIVDRCLQLDATKRFADGAKLNAALEAILGAGALPSLPVGGSRRRSVILVAAGGLAVVALASVLWRSSHSAPARFMA